MNKTITFSYPSIEEIEECLLKNKISIEVLTNGAWCICSERKLEILKMLFHYRNDKNVTWNVEKFFYKENPYDDRVTNCSVYCEGTDSKNFMAIYLEFDLMFYENQLIFVNCDKLETPYRYNADKPLTITFKEIRFKKDREEFFENLTVSYPKANAYGYKESKRENSRSNRTKNSSFSKAEIKRLYYENYFIVKDEKLMLEIMDLKVVNGKTCMTWRKETGETIEKTIKTIKRPNSWIKTTHNLQVQKRLLMIEKMMSLFNLDVVVSRQKEKKAHGKPKTVYNIPKGRQVIKQNLKQYVENFLSNDLEFQSILWNH